MNSPQDANGYNDIPVYYCKECGSLKIVGAPGFIDDYCEDCGSTEVGTASIQAWIGLQDTVFKDSGRDVVRKKKFII